MSEEHKANEVDNEQDKDERGQIKVKVLGQEGDEASVKVNPRQTCEHLLKEGLKALYGNPGPDPNQYDMVFHGKTLELTQTVAHAGITEGATVSIQPKTISRGGQ